MPAVLLRDSSPTVGSMGNCCAAQSKQSSGDHTPPATTSVDGTHVDSDSRYAVPCLEEDKAAQSFQPSPNDANGPDPTTLAPALMGQTEQGQDCSTAEAQTAQDAPSAILDEEATLSRDKNHEARGTAVHDKANPLGPIVLIEKNAERDAVAATTSPISLQTSRHEQQTRIVRSHPARIGTRACTFYVCTAACMLCMCPLARRSGT